MKLQPDRMDTLAVTGYGPGWIAVNGERHQHSLLITSKGLLQPWRPATFEALEPADFAMLTELGLEKLAKESKAVAAPPRKDREHRDRPERAEKAAK